MRNLLKKFLPPNKVLADPRPRLELAEDRVEAIYALGDVHGRLDALLEAEERIMEDARKTPGVKLVVMVGDYVDRGPHSAGVLAHLCHRLPPPLYRVSLCGNHDDEFLKFLEGPKFDTAWLSFGGDSTLLSYGVDSNYLLKLDPSGKSLLEAANNSIPDVHKRFLKKCPVSLVVGQYIFVHAGLVPGLPLDKQTDGDLMWIREPFLSRGPGGDFIVVHGHTPTSGIAYGPRRIGIDTGAFMTGRLPVLKITPDSCGEL